MNKGLVAGLAVLLLFVVIGGFLLLQNNRGTQNLTGNIIAPTQEAAPSPTPAQMRVILNEQNNSNETGEALLTEDKGNVVVTLTLTGAPATLQPAHIHTGSCPNPGAVKYPLTNVVNGSSITTLQNVTLKDLQAQMPLAINVHKSPSQISAYVACGDLGRSRAMEGTTNSTTNMTQPGTTRVPTNTTTNTTP